jgi:hypothetical protein
VPVRLTGRWFVAGSIYTCTCVRCKCRPAGWHKHVRLHLRQAPVSIDLAAPWRPVETGWRVASTFVSPVDRALFCSRIDLSSGGLAWAHASAHASGAGVNRPGCTVASRRRGWEVGGVFLIK